MTATPAEVEQQDLIGRLANRLTDLETVKAKAVSDIDAATHDITVAQAQLDAPFRHTQALAEARQRFADLDALLTAQAAPPPVGPAGPHEHDPAGGVKLRRIPVDEALDLADLTDRAGTWPVPPSDDDRRWLAATAAAIASWPDVQATALAGNASAFGNTFDQHLRAVIDGALAGGARTRDGFWASCMADPARRSELAAGTRAAAYTTIRTTARQIGLNPRPTTGDTDQRLPDDPPTPVVLAPNGRSAATSIQDWLAEHSHDLSAAPSIDEQTWLTHITATLARVGFLQTQALHHDRAAFTDAFATQFRTAVAALLADEPDLAAQAPILRAVAEPDRLADLVGAAAHAAYASIQRDAAPPAIAVHGAFTPPGTDPTVPAPSQTRPAESPMPPARPRR